MDALIRGDSGLDPFRPAHSLIHDGYTVLLARPDGSLCGEDREGLYDFDTRILSRHRLWLDGREPEILSSSSRTSDRWSGRAIVPRPGGTAEGPRLPQDVLEISMTRRIGCGLIETLDIHNHSMEPATAELGLELAADFADVQEVIGERRQHGSIETRWEVEERAVVFRYRVRHGERELERGLRVRVVESGSVPAWEDGRLRFLLELPPRGRWNATLHFESLVDGIWRRPGGSEMLERDRRREEWRRRRACLECAHLLIGPIFERAAEDLLALRNWELERGADAWVPNAGVPTYTGLFGRDALTTARQAALTGPEMMRGAIDLIAATQAEKDDAWRDEEPGKMIHEMRRGPLSELDLIPQRAYYGTETTSSMFVVVLSELWHWTGDTEVLRRHRDAALRALEWSFQAGDQDGDGFLQSVRRSPLGLKNQAWKDSDEAIRYPDGRLVENPLATIEEQAFHWMAITRMAEILVALGEENRAEDLLKRARELRRRWHAAFWMEEEGFYAMALDRDKGQVRSIGSNPGHALAAGMVSPEHARAVADRLLASDMFSGWGVRTLSAAHPSYNPLAYHLGTVWPVENATFILGFKRYGLEDHAERLATALLAAAGHFQQLRLPEALGGHGLDEAPVPTVYPRSCSPQAWSASAVILLVQALLGLYPFAPAKTLVLVRPRLPAWLDAVTLRQIRVGDARVSIRFERASDGTTGFEVLERHGPLLVVEAPPPDEVGPGSWKERLERWGLAHAPGRTARAARIALGME